MADVNVDSTSTDSKELLSQGIRAFYLEDYDGAVVALSRASELMAAEHGSDVHDTLAEVYSYYGKSLLGLSRQQDEPLGDAVPRNPQDSDDDDDEEDVDEGHAGSGDEPEPPKEGVASSTDQPEEVKKADECNGGPSTSKGDSVDEGKGNDEPTDLQVAWEVLELARQIYQRQGEASKKNLADTLVVLGEVSLESENFESAINDMKEGLEIQKQLYEDDSRVVAETYYKLGVAYSTNSQFDEAIESFETSLKYLRNRISTLEKSKDISEEEKDEIKEVTSLIPDVEEKITDMKSCKEETIKKINETVRDITKPASEAAGSASKPASDISHLVKRKRKAEDMPENETPAKQPAL